MKEKRTLKKSGSEIVEKIMVKASREYEIVVGRNILCDAGKMIKKIAKPCTVCIVTDDVVNNLYSEIVKKSLEDEGFSVIKFVFKNGEQSKNIAVFTEILEFLAKNRVTRSDIIIALGGGVIGDMAGFVASVYLRGIPLVQIPTTFLSAIDSSVGGKTAINLDCGKNLAGTFYQPSLVICDLDILSRLSRTSSYIFSDGIAEAIKYGIIADEKLFNIILNTKVNDCLEDVVTHCIKIKRDLVLKDEFDKGLRQLLNLGHTFAHSIEKCSEYKISHGHAVGIGLAMAAKASYKLGISKDNLYPQIKEVLLNNGLPYNTTYTADELVTVALNDKKRSGEYINLVLPVMIGNCVLYKLRIEELRGVFRMVIEANK